jgi:hypothetical protein
VFGQAVLTIELKAAVVVFLEQWVAFYSINRSLQREARTNSGASLNQTDSGSLSVDLARECATSLQHLLTCMKEKVIEPLAA